MPRPRLSYDQAKLNGSLAANRGRFDPRKSAPATTGNVGSPPKHFNAAQKAIWKEIAKAIPSGVAGSSDRLAVEMAARLLHQFRADPLMQASRISLLMQLLSRLGLDPQARTRLHTAPTDKPDEQDDEWSNLAATPTVPRGTPVQ